MFCVHGEWENMYVVSSPKYSHTAYGQYSGFLAETGHWLDAKDSRGSIKGLSRADKGLGGRGL